MSPMIKTALAVLLALVLGGNGLAMLFAGPWWYFAVPGVVRTGPYNPHFVKDIGAAYLVCGLALLWRAIRGPTPGAAGALIAAAGFLVLHALVHVGDELCGPGRPADFLRDFPGVFLTAILAAVLAWPSRKLA
jgi:hypothetical protein